MDRPAAEIVGVSAFRFLPNEGDNAPVLRAALKHSENVSRCEIELTRKDNSSIWVKLEVPPPKSAAEKVAEVLLVVSDITETKLRQIEIVRRSVFDELLVQILSSFASCPEPEIGSRVRRALKGIASFVGVDHAWVIVFSADKLTWSVAYEWSKAGGKSTSHTLQGMPTGALAWSESVLRAGRSITVNGPEDFPREAALEQKIWVDAGCVSRICVPIKAIRGDVVGCIGLHSHARQISWSESDVGRVTLIASATALAMERETSSHPKRVSNRVTEQTLDNPSDIATALKPQQLAGV